MKFDLEKLIGERGKRALFTMLIGIIGGLIGVSGFEIVFDEEQPEPQAISFADFQPQTDDRECFVSVRVRGLVDLARPLEVHCETTGPAVDCRQLCGGHACRHRSIGRVVLLDLWEVPTLRGTPPHFVDGHSRLIPGFGPYSIGCSSP